MKISKFRLLNFKSIEDIEIQMDAYGNGKEYSNLSIMVGINESGKSSILEGINLWYEELDEYNFNDYFHKDAKDEDYISLQAFFNPLDLKWNTEGLINLLHIDALDIDKLKIESFLNNTWKSEVDFGNEYEISISNDFPYSKYSYSNEKGISKRDSLFEELISSENGKNVFQKLTKEKLEEVITNNIHELIQGFTLPKVIYWKPSSEFLINEPIELIEFKNKPNSFIPLKNIFAIGGYDSTEKIRIALDKAETKSEFRAELEKTLSKKITNYINKIWKEHKVNINIDINDKKISVHVEDKDREFKYFNMNQRSDGFNQFISIILSLSTRNDINDLKDNVILLDEPETHLHPSGIRYLLKELLKIGINNQILVATHSPFLIDVESIDRHLIVSKNKMKTTAERVTKFSSTIYDDQVLINAFGLSVFKELLPERIIIVEGGDDKAIISHCLGLLHPEFKYSIKTAGGANKMNGIAALLANEEIEVIFILDDDHEGTTTKRNITTDLKTNYSNDNVFTLKDIEETLTEKSTIEDLLPRDFITNFFNEEMNYNFVFSDLHPFIFQLKNQSETLKNNKDQLMSKKVKLSESFKEKYFNAKQLIENAPLLCNFINKLVIKLNQKNGR